MTPSEKMEKMITKSMTNDYVFKAVKRAVRKSYLMVTKERAKPGDVHTWRDGSKHQKQSDGSWKEVKQATPKAERQEKQPTVEQPYKSARQQRSEDGANKKKNYCVKLFGESGDETVIAEGTDKKTVMRQAREYLRYTDNELNNRQIAALINNGLVHSDES